MSKKVIGFGGTYYTGWYITEDTWTDGNVTFAKTTFTYCQNLSKDPSEARMKWGTDEIDMDLRGCKTFSRTTEVVPDDCFHVGRLKGTKFANCHEYDYMGWYYDNAAYDNEKEYIRPLLEEGAGWGWSEDGMFMSPDDLEANKEWHKHCEEISRIINGTDPIEFIATTNLNDEGELLFMEGACVKFDNYKEMWYNGWPYSLPLDKKGKAKRIKNKTLVIKSWEVLSDFCIKAIDWEIKK